MSSIIEEDALTFVMFSVDWCHPCVEMMAHMSAAAEKTADFKGKIKVGIYECEEKDPLCDIYDVTAFPTFIGFREGKEIPDARYVGALGDKELLGEVRDLADKKERLSKQKIILLIII